MGPLCHYVLFRDLPGKGEAPFLSGREETKGQNQTQFWNMKLCSSKKA